MQKLAPLAIFTYNRPKHLNATLNKIKLNYLYNKTKIYFFCDNFKYLKDEKNVKEVRSIVSKLKKKNKKIILRPVNYGLQKNIVSGVNKLINKYGKVIVLEDDMITSRYFLKYMNDGLIKYKNSKNVASIHGYSYPNNLTKRKIYYFFLRGSDCWGWATWKRAWKYYNYDSEKLYSQIMKRNISKEFNFNNSYDYTGMLKQNIQKKNNSWAIKWYASTFIKNMYTLYPSKSFILNIGNDNTGTHSDYNERYNVKLNTNYKKIENIQITENNIAKEEFAKFFFSLKNFSKLRKIFNIYEKIFKN